MTIYLFLFKLLLSTQVPGTKDTLNLNLPVGERDGISWSRWALKDGELPARHTGDVPGRASS